jgi:hypothetical protein
MAQKKKQQQDRYLVKLVQELKTINDFEINLPKDNINTILDDPQKWGEEVAESFILSFIPKFIKAKKAGRKLATKIMESNDK